MRRKTAQYLLKAEALYNAYLTTNESQDEEPEQVTDQFSLLEMSCLKLKLILQIDFNNVNLPNFIGM